jgi:hypothetical protein
MAGAADLEADRAAGEIADGIPPVLLRDGDLGELVNGRPRHAVGSLDLEQVRRLPEGRRVDGVHLRSQQQANGGECKCYSTDLGTYVEPSNETDSGLTACISGGARRTHLAPHHPLHCRVDLLADKAAGEEAVDHVKLHRQQVQILQVSGSIRAEFYTKSRLYMAANSKKSTPYSVQRHVSSECISVAIRIQINARQLEYIQDKLV